MNSTVIVVLALSSAPFGEWQDTTIGTNLWASQKTSERIFLNTSEFVIPVQQSVQLAHDWMEFVEGTPDSTVGPYNFSVAMFSGEFKPLSPRLLRGVSFKLADKVPYLQPLTITRAWISYERFVRMHNDGGDTGLVLPGDRLQTALAEEKWAFVHEGATLQVESRVAAKERGHELMHTVTVYISESGGQTPF